jgi:hypothetical protein
VRIVHWRLIAAARSSRSSLTQPGKAVGDTGVMACKAAGGAGVGAAGGIGWGATPGRPEEGAGLCGAVQPAAIATAQAIMAATCKDRIMWVIYLEAGLVVSMVLLIVWWTMRGK